MNLMKERLKIRTVFLLMGLLAAATPWVSARDKKGHGQFIVRYRIDPGENLTKSATGLHALSQVTVHPRIKNRRPLFKNSESGSFRIQSRSERDTFLSNMFVLEALDASEMQDIIKDFKADPNVIFAEPNYEVELLTAPNDPLYTNGSQSALKRLNPEPAWTYQTGSPNVLIAIVDTGIDDQSTGPGSLDVGHPDFGFPQKKFWTNTREISGNGRDDDNNGLIDDVHGWDYVNDDNDPYDDFGHGTPVAGIAAAVGNNDRGVAGVAWGCPILPLKVIGKDGRGVLSDILDAITYAVDHGARVINMSIVVSEGFQPDSLATTVAYAESRNVVIVAGSGNAGNSTATYPAAYDTVLAVAGVDENDVRAGFTTYGTWVDVTAPSVNVYTTWNGFDSYGAFGGTSAAAPFVSGLAALLISENPTLSAAQVRQLIRSGTQSIDSLNPGFAGLLGTGRIDISKTLDQIAAHALTVNNGIGTGSYRAGQIVTIYAAPAPANQIFDQWAGAPVTNIFSATTTLVMPNEPISVTATYKNIPTFQLTVNNGMGSGAYRAGDVVTLYAAAAPPNQVFDQWIGAPVADIFSATTTLVMPDQTTAVTATYKSVASFQLTIQHYASSSAGSIIMQAQQFPGAALQITAPDLLGYEFISWSSNVPLPSAHAKSFLFTMPAQNVLLQPLYTSTQLTLTVPAVNQWIVPDRVVEYKGGCNAGTQVEISLVATTGALGGKKVLSCSSDGNWTTTLTYDGPRGTGIILVAQSGNYSMTQQEKIGVVFDSRRLAVISGDGTGDYAPGEKIILIASAPAKGFSFDHWSGGTISNSSDATFTLTMPSENISLKAEYTLTPPPIVNIPPVTSGFEKFSPEFDATRMPSLPISVALAKEDHVQLRVYNLNGEIIRTIYDGNLNIGAGQPLPWNGRNDEGGVAATNVYMLVLNIGGEIHKKRIALMR